MTTSPVMRLASVLSLLFILLLTTAACNSSEYDSARSVSYADYDRYGSGDMVAETVSASDVTEDYVGREISVEGTITEVCRNAGCWFIFPVSDERVIRVHVPKDADDEYEFTLPADVSGRHAVVHGLLETRALTVEQQQHYAGESESGEAAHVEYRLVARSVLVSPTA